MKNLSCLLSLLFIAVSGASCQTPAPPPFLYVVRYLCFTAMPKPGAVFEPGTESAIFDKMQEGWPVPLTSNPQDFLNRLRQQEPRYTYQANLAGQSVRADDGSYLLRGGPEKNDPRQCRVDYTVWVLKRDSPTLIHTHMKGMMHYKASPAGETGWGLDDTMVAEGNKNILGQTKSMGIDGAAEKTIFVYCFLEASAANGGAKTRLW